MSNIKSHAMAEFRAAGWIDGDGKYCDEIQELMCKQLLELLELFSSHGHSGNSAPYALRVFSKLAAFKPLVPLTGEDWEWVEVSFGLFQNNRCSHVFMENGQAYDSEGTIFWEWYTDHTGQQEKVYFTSRESRKHVYFPYTPTKEYRERAT